MEDNEQNIIGDENADEIQSSTAGQADEASERIEQLRSEQNIMGGILGGFLGAIAGAALWAIITAITKYQIGYMAIGVGFLTGFMVRKLGQGIEKKFGFIGALWSLIGCYMGNILAILIMFSQDAGIPFMTILSQLDIEILIGVTIDTFSPMDLFFYGIAVYEGYRFSFLTIDEINLKLHRITNKEAA